MTIERARQLEGDGAVGGGDVDALRQLKRVGLHFRRQVQLGRYYADFACYHPKLVIEIDGQSHTRPDYDAARDAFMQSEGYRVVRVSNEDVRHNVEGVMRLVMIATYRD